MPTALVTGITGQDGGYLAERLAAEGWDVHGLVIAADPMLPDLLARVPGAVLHEGDLSDEATMSRLVDAVEPAEIYNLGGISSVAFSWEHPLLTAQVTGIGAVVLYEAAWRTQQRLGRPVRVLQASSAEIFGTPAESPQTERTPLRPETPYGAAKAFAHTMAAVYRTRGLPVSTCILYNHESPRRPETFVTRKITRAAARISAGLQDSVSLGNLDARRDWGWAQDYVEAMVRAVRHDGAGDYVIGTGTAHSVRDFVAVAFTHCGLTDWESRVRVEQALTRPSDVPEQLADPTLAKTVLGWSPTVTFEQMVTRMVDVDLREAASERAGG